MYCGKVCAGLARRAPPKSDEQKRAEKAEYDRNRRAENEATLKAQKKAFYEANRERILSQMTVYRKTRMPAHVEYCRRPDYKVKKRQYDMRRNEQEFAEFAETWRLLQDLEKEIRSQASAYEVRVQQGYYTRNAQKRRRELWQLIKATN